MKTSFRLSPILVVILLMSSTLFLGARPVTRALADSEAATPSVAPRRPMPRPGASTGAQVWSQRVGATSPDQDASAAAAFPVACAPHVTVQNAGDSGAGSLRQALGEVCSGGTVDFAPALAGQTITLASQLTIAQSVTVDGRALSSPITVSGNDAVRVLEITAGRVTLAGVTVAHGNAPLTTCPNGTNCSGGGIRISAGAAVTLTHSAVLSNTANYKGGGIYQSGATLTVLASTVAHNSAREGGGIWSGSSALSVRDSFVSENVAGIIGGSIDADGGGTLSVQNSVFSPNKAYSIYTYTDDWGEVKEQAQGQGGGLFVYPGISSATVERSTFSDNMAGSNGGGMFSGSPNTIVRDSMFSDNRARVICGGLCIYATDTSYVATVENSTFSDNAAGISGGGIHAEGATLRLYNSTLTDNAAYQDGGGGGLWMEDVALDYRNTIIANSRSGDCVHTSATIVTNSHNLVEDGSCSAGGVGFLTGDPRLDLPADNGGPLAAGQPILTHALLEGSPAENAGAGCLATDQRGAARPQGAACDIGAYERGLLHLTRSATPAAIVPYHGLVTYTLVLTNTSPVMDPSVWLTETLPAGMDFERWLSSPTGSTDGGGEIRWHGELAAGQARTWVYAARNTGAFLQAGDYGDWAISRARVRSSTNPGTSATAVLQVECGDALTVKNFRSEGACSLRDVVARAPADARIVFRPEMAGHTIQLQALEQAYPGQVLPAPTVWITRNLTLDAGDLSAPLTIDGNRIARIFVITDTAQVTLDNLTLAHGHEEVGGGGALLMGNGTVVTLTHTTVYSNTAVVGGGIAVSRARLNVLDSVFDDNAAITGGGIFVWANASPLAITRSTFSNNHSDRYGGGIYYHTMWAYETGGPITIDDSTFAGNTASTGGGIEINWAQEGSVTINNSTFVDNHAPGFGGGALRTFHQSIHSPVWVTINNGRFTDNSALVHGAAIQAEGPLTVNNVTFTGNLVTASPSAGLGHAIRAFSAVTMTNSTMSGNTGGLYAEGGLYPSVAILRNNIIANNVGTVVPDCAATLIDVNLNNLIEDGSCASGTVFQGFLSGDPRLGPLADNGGDTQTHALLLDSPAIDSGDDTTCLPADQRGVMRPQGAHCDRGAYELAAPTARTDPASQVTGTGATLNGTVNARDADATVSFEYGLTDAYGATLPGVPSPVGVGGDTQVSAILGGLQPGAVYHYRVTATNAAGTVRGGDLTFRTSELPEPSEFTIFLPLLMR